MQEPSARRGYAVFLGLDVGKGEHHATALDPEGHRVHDRPLPQDEHALRALFDQLSGHGPVLVVVDQPACRRPRETARRRPRNYPVADMRTAR